MEARTNQLVVVMPEAHKWKIVRDLGERDVNATLTSKEVCDAFGFFGPTARIVAVDESIDVLLSAGDLVDVDDDGIALPATE